MTRLKKASMNIRNINQNVVDFQYAVRGAQAIRAEELQLIINTTASLPFSKITNCNIGNPQQLKQKPITFFRQIASLTEWPQLMQMNLKCFPTDVIVRAKELLAATGGSIGAYSSSQGVSLIRKRVAQFISMRDACNSDPENIFLTAGASAGVQMVLQTIIAHKHVGIMIPCPQYPLYTASISMFGGTAVPYYLNEQRDWEVSLESLQESLKIAKHGGVTVRALCIINPGNPTGQCLTEGAMKDIVMFCQTEKLVLLADEVYQTNIYAHHKPFISFKKIVVGMDAQVELISFHSISKGKVGECGRRGGYFECFNIDEKVKEMFYKIASVSLCPPVAGQILVEAMVNPPKLGDPSYPLYNKEMSDIGESLERRAIKLCAAFNQLEGVTCNSAEGALYLFPTITLSPRAIEYASKLKQQPDEFYAMELLNATGVCVVAGSGFGQKPDTWHFRSTFLPQEEELDDFILAIKNFHCDFMDKYRI